MEELLINGWKDIAQALGVRSVKTAKRLVEKYSIPINYLNRRPTILKSMFESWYFNVVKIARKRRMGKIDRQIFDNIKKNLKNQGKNGNNFTPSLPT